MLFTSSVCEVAQKPSFHGDFHTSFLGHQTLNVCERRFPSHTPCLLGQLTSRSWIWNKSEGKHQFGRGLLFVNLLYFTMYILDNSYSIFKKGIPLLQKRACFAKGIAIYVETTLDIWSCEKGTTNLALSLVAVSWLKKWRNAVCFFVLLKTKSSITSLCELQDAAFHSCQRKILSVV